MRKTRLASYVFFLSVFFGFALLAACQDATTGSISGTISDSSGALIKGATVTLINSDRNHVERTLTTSNSGFYTATALPLGTYTVKITGTSGSTTASTTFTLTIS